MALVSCKNNDSNIVRVVDYQYTFTLAGEPISFDSILAVPGSVEVVGDEYVFFIFDHPNLLMKTDTDFRPIATFMPRGNGHGEMNFIGGEFGRINGNDGIAAYDPSKMHIVEVGANGEFVGITTFPDEFNSLSMRSVRLMDNGRYAGVRNLHHYGMGCYDPQSHEVQIWPNGLGILDDGTLNTVISGNHNFRYNASRHLLAEKYAALPYVIIRDEDGNVIRILQLDDMMSLDDISTKKPCYVQSLRLTDDYIYIAGPSDETNNSGELLVIDYEGNGIAKLNIGAINEFAIDEKNKRLITVSPNSDPAVMSYSLDEMPWLSKN